MSAGTAQRPASQDSTKYPPDHFLCNELGQSAKAGPRHLAEKLDPAQAGAPGDEASVVKAPPIPPAESKKGRRIGTQNQLLDSVGEDCRAPNGNALIWRGVTSGLSGRSPVSTEIRKPKSCRCAGLPGPCSAYASPSAKAGGAVRGLLCVVYPGTLRPCHHGLPAPGGQSHVETALKSHLGQTKTERNQAAKETPSESVNSDGVLLFEKGYKRFLVIPRSADT